MSTCPYCAEDISAQDSVCPYCKSELAASTVRGPKKGMGGGMIALIALVVLIGLGAVIAVPLALILPAVQQARSAARITQSKNNLKQIGLALHNYHEVYQKFPPAYVEDANGKPLYSWRVLILPFLDESPLYEQFDKTKAWDSPENEFLLNSMPLVFRCPFDTTPNSTSTAYVGIFGANCMFQGPNGVRIADIQNGLSNVAMVTESANTATPWSSPSDLDTSQLGGIGSATGPSSNNPRRGVHMLMGDGAVQYINQNTAPGTLKGFYEISNIHQLIDQ